MTAPQSQALRLAGYFLLVLAAITSIGCVSAIWREYVIAHRWPAAGATIYSTVEHSREVKPPSSSSRRYWVYWAEFVVDLDLPAAQCPGGVTPWTDQRLHCIGTVKSPDERSRTDTLGWIKRHPNDSKALIHYDAGSERMAFAGESVLYTYPWRNISAALTFMLAGILMLALGKTAPNDAVNP